MEINVDVTMMISIVIPVFNEKESLSDLYLEITKNVSSYEEWEIIFIDDGSSDGSKDKIIEFISKDSKVKLISFYRNFGKSAALSEGFKHSKGDIIITMDADLQDDPVEIPNLINKINEENKYIHILVAGPWNSNIAEEIINNVKIKNVFNYSHLHLSEVAALLKLSNIFIGNDSGILNLSAAVGTKSLGLFGATKSFAYSHNIYPVIAKEGEISKDTDRMLDGKGKTIKNADFAKRVKVDDVLIAFYKVVNS